MPVKTNVNVTHDPKWNSRPRFNRVQPKIRLINIRPEKLHSHIPNIDLLITFIYRNLLVLASFFADSFRA